jgi:hypothetical protein
MWERQPDCTRFRQLIWNACLLSKRRTTGRAVVATPAALDAVPFASLRLRLRFEPSLDHRERGLQAMPPPVSPPKDRDERAPKLDQRAERGPPRVI